MNMMKKVAVLLAVLSLVFAGVSCAKKEAPAAAQAPAAAEKGLKIAIVTSPSGVDDGSFNQDVYNGILAFIKTVPSATVKAVNEPTGDVTASVKAVADIVADYDIIVTPGFQFAGIATIAKENPTKKFILVDTYPAFPEDPFNSVVLDNIYAMQFAEQESGFFAGIAAALETKTGKVAVVNGIAFPSNVNYQYGFEAGVQYANAKMGKKVKIIEIASYAGTDVTKANVGGNYVGDFNDVATGKVVGNALIKQGCDIIFVAAGNSGNGVFTAAKEAGNVKVIGCDVDQYNDGVNGDKNIILTCALKNMAINVERQLNALKDGTFKGSNNLLKADTDSTGFVKAAGRHQLSEATLKACDEAYALVKAGTIVPPSNFSGTKPEDFPGLK